MASKPKPKRFRSAKTGRFVSAKYARRHKATTVGERLKPGYFTSAEMKRTIARALAKPKRNPGCATGARSDLGEFRWPLPHFLPSKRKAKSNPAKRRKSV